MTLLTDNSQKKEKQNAAIKDSLSWDSIRRRAWQLPKRQSVSEWADENRILDPKISAEPGHWHTNRTPYLRGIMDALVDRNVEQITIKSSTQIGKTESLLNMLGYVIDQDPGPALFVMPRKDDARSINKDRIQPMIQLAPALSRHLTAYDDDVTQFVVGLDRMIVYLAWANSPAALASKPIRFLFLDEVNKYPSFSGREADPIKLATERTRTFWNRKIIKVSTPTTAEGYISREYDQSDKCQYHIPCAHCGKYQPFVFANLRFSKSERRPDAVRASKKAYYECVKCKKAITDSMKQTALRDGVWVPAGARVAIDGTVKLSAGHSSHRGFWLNALYSPWLSFSDIAAEWLSCQGRSELLMNFVNSWLAEEWKEKVEERKPDQLRKHACEYEVGTVPEGAVVLTAGVDVQLDHFYYVIRAWGVGYESWLVDAGRVESWEEVFSLVFNRSFPSVNKNIEPFQTRLVCVDTGYRTDEVYDICREWIGLARPIKGQHDLRGLIYKPSHIDKYPDGRVIQGGLRLYHIDTNLLKDKLARLISSGMDNTVRKFHLHRNPKKIYLDQMCAEGKVLERGKKNNQREVWKKIAGHQRCDFWDCEVYAISAAEMLRVYGLREHDVARPAAPQKIKIKRENTGWIKRNKNWMNK